ncbi:type II toxin-antitoxin system death-on-curing family toxin [Xanthobacter pseudotagetidis]|uniref:type II toxin-antitoxin system death-on-curing family toxin n=1 Tax=Xanthobacter pseudotagetidis TaxID=3119911 RepID=UPI003728E25C
MKENDVIQHIKSEHDRWIKTIGMADPYLDRVTIGIHEVLQAHFLLAEYFATKGEGIGGLGPKNIDLLHSALSRQFVQYGGKPKWKNGIDICATLMFGLIKNHPFHDANKRTAFLTSILHLQKIGRTPTIKDLEYEDFTVNIAENNLDIYDFSKRIDAPSPDREIMIISHFLKRGTREISLKNKFITYNELKLLLSKRGLGLEKPNGNRIDLVRYVDTDGETMLDRPKRIAHIGFHGWSKEVSAKDIGIVRESARLDARHGYDSQSFFNGLDDPLTLIRKYKEPLERLAFR